VQIPQGIDELADSEQQGDLRRPLPEGDDRESEQRRGELLDTDGALPDWLAETIVSVLIEVYAGKEEGGLEFPGELPDPHPRNLFGQAFQDGLGDGAGLLGHWLEVLGIDNAGMAFADLRRAVAPDLPEGLKVPPGFPLPWEVQAAYRFLLSWFKRSYLSSFDMDKPKRPTIFTVPASDYNFGPPDFSGVNPHDDPISEGCEVLAALLDWLWKTLEKAGQLLYDLAKSALSAGTMPAREALYENVTLPAWQVTENIRMVLVHLGYLMPQSEERYADTGEVRKPSEIDLELVTLGHTVDGAFAAALAGCFDVLGNLDADPALTADTIRNPKSANYPWLPVRETNGRTVVEFRRPWAYPDRTNDPDPRRAGGYLETPLTTAGPYPQNARPPVLLGTKGPASNRMRFDYEHSRSSAETDEFNESFVGHAPFTEGYPGAEGQDVSGTNPLGDPVVFSAYLIGQISGNASFAANFNLDADRGYGYLCWDWDRQNDNHGQRTNLRGQPYAPPTTWPEGADEWTVPPPTPVNSNPAPRYPVPLQLHYLTKAEDQ
jgi:hypothetical protein